jgi:hypothetical protein
MRTGSSAGLGRASEHRQAVPPVRPCRYRRGQSPATSQCSTVGRVLLARCRKVRLVLLPESSVCDRLGTWPRSLVSVGSALKTTRSSTGGRLLRHLRGSAVPGGASSAVVLLLVGCSSAPSQPHRSSTLARVNEQLAALPRLKSAAVTIETTTDGTAEHHSLAVDASALDLGASRGGVADLINRVFALAWSIGGDRPDNGVVLRLRTSPQLPIGPIAEAAGWDDVGFPTNDAAMQKVAFQATFSAEELDEQLGPWPAWTAQSAQPSRSSASSREHL